jgi:zinc protease
LGDRFRTVLKGSGHVAYVAADSSLPLITIEAYIRSGSLNDPAGKEGLGSLAARLLRAGGTARYPADTLDALIDQLAMRFSFSQTESHIGFSASFLSDYADTALAIMREMFFSPVFEQKRFDRERSIMIENISHRFANPGPTLSIAYRKQQYPKTAAARLMTEASLKSIKRADVAALHKAAFERGGMIISAAGKFDRDGMIARLDSVFRKPSEGAAAPFPEIAVAPETRALVVHKDITQAYVRMGLPLFRRPHPDYYPAAVLNFILGGSGFISRLGTRVRSDEGLTYSIYSTAESNYTYAGTLYIEFFTKTDLYPKAVSIVLDELANIVKNGVTEAELDNARSALISELPSSFRSPEDIVSTYAWNEFYGRAPDHYAKYPGELMKLTRDDIQNAAKKYIDVDKITYAIVGDTAAINEAGKTAPANGFFVLDSLKNKLVITADSLAHLR